MDDAEYGNLNMNGDSNGCLKGCVIGCASVCLIVVILLYLGYSALVHSPMPLQAIAGILSDDPNVEITGVDGSLSSGVSVEKIRVKDDNGKMNEVDNAGFTYDYDDDYIELVDLHVERAHFYYDETSKTTTKSSGSGSSSRHNRSSGSSDEIERLLVTKVDIRDVTFENAHTGELVTIDKVVADSLVCGKESSSLKEFTVASSFCNISILPFDASDKESDKYTFSASIQKSIHARVLKDIMAEGTFLMNGDSGEDSDLTAFDGAVVCKWFDGREHLVITNFSPIDYYSHMFCLRNINLDLLEESDGTRVVKAADFSIGSRVFEFDRTVFETEEIPDAMEAVSDGPTIKYFCTLSRGADDLPLFSLRSEPAMSLEDILSELLFEGKYDSLGAEHKAVVDKQLGFCSLSEGYQLNPMD